jgi:ligand-binding sensor domain-containing protein/two-component sensor histidine kinase
MRFLFSLLLFFPCWLFAQQTEKILCKHYNKENGLIQGNIYDLVQDKEGFIWIAGEEGLQRFDGYEFVKYYHNPNKVFETFPSGRLNSLAVDNSNKLWVGSFSSGFGWYSSFTNTNKLYIPQNEKLLALDEIGFRDLLIVNDSITYVSSNIGVVKLINNVIVKKITTENSALQGGLTGCLAKDKNGNIWIGTINGLNFLSKDEKYLYNHTNNQQIKAFDNNVLKSNVGNKAAIAKIFIDSRNNLWISTWKPEFYRYDIDRNTLEIIQLPNKKNYEYDNLVYDVIEDNEKNIWIGTSNNGLYKYNYTNNSFEHFLHDINNYQSIGSNNIHCLMKDKNGNIWMAGNNIISTFNPSYKLITPLLPFATHSIAATFIAADKTLWAVDVEWLYHLDENLQFISKYKHQQLTTNKFNNGVWCLKESRNGKEIFIGKENGLSIFNKQTKQVDLLKGFSILLDNPITGIIETTEGNLYLLRWWWAKNLLYFNRATSKIEPVNMPISDKNNFEIGCELKLNDSNYYLFTKRGLMMLETNKQQVKMLNETYRTGNTILYNDEFYGATASTGIMVYNKKNNKIYNIDALAGLPSNNTKSIIYTNNNNFWIATTLGLVKWNKDKNIFSKFSEYEGISQPSIAVNSLVATNNGQIIFSNGKLLMLDTKLIKQPSPPTVKILRCLVGDSLITPENFDTKIVIHYNNNMLQINFAVINSVSVKYEYMLEGYDKDWKDGSLRFVNYINLGHGNYTFKVRAINNDGIASKDVTQLKFYVTQAFYKAWWFYVLLGIIVLSAILLYYRIRISKILELQKLRNNISRDLHDEVGSTLSSISIISTSVINNMEKHPQKTKEWVQQIGSDAQQMMNVMDDIVWSINPKMDSFESIVNRMKEAAFKLAESTDIKVHFNYAENINNISLSMLIKRNMYLIYKEAVNNAVKHSACKNIVISIHKLNNQIVLKVNDDGKGFIMQESNRNGIKNMKYRATEINANIIFESKENEGSTMQLNLML